MLLALTFALKDIAGPPTADTYRRLTGQRLVLVFLGVALALSVFWYPVISAVSVPYDFWHMHMWLDSWV
jgi:dolichyl-phosphate-mannose--protein O-mannosyl transferase